METKVLKYDFLHKPLAVGDYVLYQGFSQFTVATITHFTDKMVGVKTRSKKSKVKLKYSNDLIRIDEKDLMIRELFK